MRDLSPEELKQQRDIVRNLLERSDKGKPRATIDNYHTVLCMDPQLSAIFQYNEFTGRIDVTTDPLWPREPGLTFTENDFRQLLLLCEQNYDLHGERQADHALNLVAMRCAYHPVRDYLKGLIWDGETRIAHALHHFLGAEDNEFNAEAMLVFLSGAIARVMDPGCKFETTLCLVGGQGAGKSSFFRLLAVRDEWFSDDLRRLDDENIYRRLAGHWIIEMSEMLATANAKSIEEIKSFLSRQKETYKVPYETHPADRPRQCVFGGTTNTDGFLPSDRSGNRRFVPVRIDAAKAEVHPLADEAAARAYIDQLWAEAMIVWKAGQAPLCLSPEAERNLAEVQQDFMPEDTLAGVILDWLAACRRDRVCTRMIFAEALGRTQEPKRYEIREIAEIINRAIDRGELKGWRATSNAIRFPGYGVQRGWVRLEERQESLLF